MNLTTFFSLFSLDERTAALNRDAASRTLVNLELEVEKVEGRLWEQLIPSLVVNRTDDSLEQFTRSCPCSERLELSRGKEDPGRGGERGGAILSSYDAGEAMAGNGSTF